MKNHYKFWIIFSLILVFAAGVTGGILIDKLFIQKSLERGGPPGPHRSIEMMAKELNLSSEQQEKIREIFKNNEEGFKSLRKDFFDHLSEIRTRLKNEIKNVLTEEQGKKFEAMIEREESQMKREQERRHPERHEKQDKGGER